MEREPRTLRSPVWRSRLREPRTLAALLGVAVVVGFAAAAVISGSAPDVRGVIVVSPTPSGTQAIVETSTQPTAVPSASFSLLPDWTPVPPEGRPEGVDRVAQTSAPIGPPRWPSPTPTADPQIWRFEGVVVDAEGKPLQNVCVIIGPGDCPPRGLRTDEGGRYSVDLPQNATIRYSFRFALDGYEVVLHRAQPNGPTVFNVILPRV
jgi:hypothetical protein